MAKSYNPKTDLHENIKSLFSQVKNETQSSEQTGIYTSTHDFKINTQNQLVTRGELYNQLLGDYVVLSKTRNDSKEAKKDEFFTLIELFLIVSVIVFLLVLIWLFLYLQTTLLLCCH